MLLEGVEALPALMEVSLCCPVTTADCGVEDVRTAIGGKLRTSDDIWMRDESN